MTASDLLRLTRKRAESEEAWRAAIREAHASGMSLRAIAACVGVAHTRVHTIVHDK